MTTVESLSVDVEGYRSDRPIGEQADSITWEHGTGAPARVEIEVPWSTLGADDPVEAWVGREVLLSTNDSARFAGRIVTASLRRELEERGTTLRLTALDASHGLSVVRRSCAWAGGFG